MTSFDVEKTPPFLAFRYLREVAAQAVGEAHVLDLSQGEPGYGFSPSRRSRRFMAFLMLLDAELNDHEFRKTLFAYRKPEDLPEIEAKIIEVAQLNFTPDVATEMLNDWNVFITTLETVLKKQEVPYSRFDIFYDLFKYSTISGGRYPQPTGHLLLQALAAEEYSESLGGIKVWHDELITVSGASHGIGSIFKGLGREGISYLKADDTVCMTSPVYAPYNLMFNQRGIRVRSLSVDPETGDLDFEKIEKLKNSYDRIKCIVLINPNNPTGFAANKKFLEAIADLAEVHNSLIVTDEVYHRFFDDNFSITNIKSARKRLLRIDSISKIERSTGLRVGNIYVSKEANKYISEEILGHYLGDYPDVHTLLMRAKSPGGKNIGLFQHITGIPGPSIALALSHLILGKAERHTFIEDVRKKMDIFYETIGIPRGKNLYYGIIDLKKVESPYMHQVSIEEKLEKIAQKGVVLMPAHLFFSRSDQRDRDRRNYIRVSLPNLNFENTKKAAQIIKEILS